MTDQALNNLFDRARNEALETSVNDVRKWIGLVTIGTIILGTLAKMKIVLTKKLVIMLTSTILTAGAGVTLCVAVLSGNPSPEKEPSVKRSVPPTIQVEPQETTPEEDAITLPLTETPEEAVVPERKESPSVVLPLRRVFPVEREVVELVSPEVVAAPKDYGTFTSLKISGAVDVVLKQGEKCDVRIEGDPAGIEMVIVENHHDMLDIYTDSKGKRCNNNCDVTIYVTIVDLRRIDASGATNLESDGVLTSDKLEIISSGASDMQLQLSANQLKIDCSGASDMELQGEAKSLILFCSGASELKAEQLVATEARLDCSGASKTNVHVSKRLDAEASGASDVHYKGHPEHTSISVTGASKIRQL